MSRDLPSSGHALFQVLLYLSKFNYVYFFILSSLQYDFVSIMVVTLKNHRLNFSVGDFSGGR